jgi:predicted RNA-binding Zn-ribbon protein involved in translation (DUF1610 family)
MEKKCSALKTSIANVKGSVTFKCPNCSESEITRSSKARTIVAKYKCQSCGFEGPN